MISLLLVYQVLLLGFVISQRSRATNYNNAITFARIDITSDTHKHLSIKLYGQSREMVLMHTMILFHSPSELISGREVNADNYKRWNRQASLNKTVVYGHYHNALIIGGHAYHLYNKITKDSHFEYNNEIELVARGDTFVLPYSVASSGGEWGMLTKQTTSTLASLVDYRNIMSLSAASTTSGSSTAALPTYHALLSLDRYSSIWDRYNVMRLTRYTMSMVFRDSARLSDSLGEFTGMVRIECERTQHALDQRCMVKRVNNAAKHGLWVSGQFYPSYRVVIDLHSSVNYLPNDLYFDRLSATSTGAHSLLRLNLSTGNELPIHDKFKFLLNEHSNDVILGVDLLRYFPQMEYSVVSERIHLWYHADLYTHQYSYRSSVIVFIFIVIVVIFCYIHWKTSTNYRLFKFITLYSRVGLDWFYFEHSQALTEVVAVVIAMPIVIIVILFIDSTQSLQFQRTIMLLLMCGYEVTILICVLIMSVDPLGKALFYYTNKKEIERKGHDNNNNNNSEMSVTDRALGRAYFGEQKTSFNATGPVDTTKNTDEHFDHVKDEFIDGYTERLIKIETSHAIMHCAALVQLVWVELLLVLNFSTLQNHLFLILFLVVSLLLVYYSSYFISLSALYTMAIVRVPRLFIAFLVSQCVALVFFISWSLHCFYWDYFNSISTIYNETEIILFIGTLVTIVVVMGAFTIYSNLDEIVRNHYT